MQSQGAERFIEEGSIVGSSASLRWHAARFPRGASRGMGDAGRSTNLIAMTEDSAAKTERLSAPMNNGTRREVACPEIPRSPFPMLPSRGPWEYLTDSWQKEEEAALILFTLSAPCLDAPAVDEPTENTFREGSDTDPNQERFR